MHERLEGVPNLFIVIYDESIYSLVFIVVVYFVLLTFHLCIQAFCHDSSVYSSPSIEETLQLILDHLKSNIIMKDIHHIYTQTTRLTSYMTIHLSVLQTGQNAL